MDRRVTRPEMWKACWSPSVVTRLSAASMHPEVRVAAQCDAEVEVATLVDAIEPVAIVGIAIVCRRLRDGFGGLMDRIVVERGEHPSTVGEIAPIALTPIGGC